MTKLSNISALNTLMAASLLMLNTVAYAAPAPVVIKTYGQHIGGNIVYTHLLTNNTIEPIVSFAIGEYSDRANINVKDYTNRGELRVLPVGSTDEYPTGPVLSSSVSGLPGWRAVIEVIEESGPYMSWLLNEDPSAPRIQPGQTARFSVTVPQMDNTYVSGHFTTSAFYNGTMEKLDITPPVLTVTLNPAATTLAQRGQLVPINATITVTDDYDPAPEIKLLSIVANQPLTPADVQGAAIGTDDRSFSLLASRTNPMVIRTYMISYIATDASGNTARASVLLKIN